MIAPLIRGMTLDLFAFEAPPAPSLASISVQASKCAPDALARVIRQRWSLTFDDRNPMSVIVWPGATRAEVLEQWPSALSATPADLGHTESTGPPERSHSRVMRTSLSR